MGEALLRQMHQSTLSVRLCNVLEADRGRFLEEAMKKAKLIDDEGRFIDGPYKGKTNQEALNEDYKKFWSPQR